MSSTAHALLQHLPAVVVDLILYKVTPRLSRRCLKDIRRFKRYRRDASDISNNLFNNPLDRVYVGRVWLAFQIASRKDKLTPTANRRACTMYGFGEWSPALKLENYTTPPAGHGAVCWRYHPDTPDDPSEALDCWLEDEMTEKGYAWKA